MKKKCLNLIYFALYRILFVPLASLRIIYKAHKNPKYLYRFNERFARYGKYSDIFNIDQPIWFHTVSVGEFLAAKSLIMEIFTCCNNDVLITTTTPTGSELVEKYIKSIKGQHLKNNKMYHVYYPYDNPRICRRFLNIIKPKLALFFETEIWPKMFDQIKKQNIKLYIINARLSEKSFKGYKKILDLIQQSLNRVDYIATQSDEDASRFKNLGYKNQINNFGNVKYNISLPNDLKFKSESLLKFFNKNVKSNAQNNLILIAASTHAKEEEILLNIFQNLKLEHSSLKLILVPRHPERFKDIYALCKSTRFNVTKYSDHVAQDKFVVGDMDREDFDIFLLDTLGQLLYFYNIADVAFIGGSMVDIGGHNPLEPAILHVPCVIGPYYYNFNDIVSKLSHNSAIVIADNASDLESKISNLLAKHESRTKIAEAAYTNIMQHQGVLHKYTKLITSAVSDHV